MKIKTINELRHELAVALWRVRQLQWELAYDELTGLRKSHGYFSQAVVASIDRMEKKKDSGKVRNRFSGSASSYVHVIAYADLDGLKFCNDTFGHEFGDWLLQTLANILLHCTRRKDIVVRRGKAADEFLIFFGAITREKVEERLLFMRNRFDEAVRSRVENSLKVLSDDPTLGGEELELLHRKYEILLRVTSFSYGWDIVPAHPRVEDVKEVIRNTERSMYREKERRGMERRR